MINVIYPIKDLILNFFKLLADLKPTDWDKTTFYKNEKVSVIAIRLLKSKFEFLTNYTETDRAILKVFNDPIDLNSVNLLVPKLSAIVENTEHLDGLNIPKIYAEFWLQQQHLRHSIYNQQLMEKPFYFPFLNYKMMALAKHYEDIVAAENNLVKVDIVGEAGGVWLIKKQNYGWEFTTETQNEADAIVYIDQQIAWLLLTGGVNLMEANQYYQILGDKNLGSHVLNMGY